MGGALVGEKCTYVSKNLDKVKRSYKKNGVNGLKFKFVISTAIYGLYWWKRKKPLLKPFATATNCNFFFFSSKVSN